MNSQLLEQPEWSEFFGTWAKTGILSFGGPAGQIAMMHRTIVDEKRWMDERDFLDALGFCMLLPGPEAMQLATYSGWRLRGVPGGLIAGLLFILPGALVVLALAMAYVAYGKLPVAVAMFLGIKAAVVVIVLQALLKLSSRALVKPFHWVLASASFAAIYGAQFPFPLIVLIAGCIGMAAGETGKEPRRVLTHNKRSLMGTAATIAVWMALWWMPVLALHLADTPQILADLSVFFSKLAVVTFGGAYAVLAYMTQDVVGLHGWLNTSQMVDGLGLAETTPGPLILVTEFVGFLAAEKSGGMGLGIAGALVTLWVTFVPCFLWIFAGAPYIDWMTSQSRLSGALGAITAAVVGVVLNLSLWFAMHVLFTELTTYQIGAFRPVVPILPTIDWTAASLLALSVFTLIILKWNIIVSLGIAAVAGLLMAGLA